MSIIAFTSWAWQKLWQHNEIARAFGIEGLCYHPQLGKKGLFIVPDLEMENKVSTYIIGKQTIKPSQNLVS